LSFLQVEIISDEEDEEEDVIALTDEKFKPISLEKMISLISLLVEQSRGEDRDLQLIEKDYNAIVGGKGFPFLFSQVRDSINLRQTCNLIFSMCRWNERLAVAVS
jgi:ubiquitin carboxyl-terminal hydrolase 34